MQEIIIVNGNAEINAYKLAQKENKIVLSCDYFSDYGIMYKPNGEIIKDFKLSKVIIVNRGKGFSGSQCALTTKNLPKERGIGYVS